MMLIGFWKRALQVDVHNQIDMLTYVCTYIWTKTKFLKVFFYDLATAKFVSGQVPTYDSAYSWRLYSAAPLQKEAVSTMTWYPTQSHLDTDSTGPILLILSTWLGSDKYQFYNSLFWLDPGFEPTISFAHESSALLIRPSGTANALRAQCVRTGAIIPHLAQYLPSRCSYWPSLLWWMTIAVFHSLHAEWSSRKRAGGG